MYLREKIYTYNEDKLYGFCLMALINYNLLALEIENMKLRKEKETQLKIILDLLEETKDFTAEKWNKIKIKMEYKIRENI